MAFDLLYSNQTGNREVTTMDYVIPNYRNIMIAIVIISTISLLPETAYALTKPILILWLRIKRYQQSFLSRPLKRNCNKFWEIDMTKLEP
jgi:hypothetical protein